MNSFLWNDSYVTGLVEVDEQHKRLVEIINKFGQAIAQAEDISDPEVDAAFQQLLAYAAEHFAQEEALMRRVGMDQGYFLAHQERHQSFVSDVQRLYSTKTQDLMKFGESLLRFLIYWLAYHILGTDKSMARQLAFIEAGHTAEEALLHERDDQDGAVEPLLQALNGLFQQVSERNRELQHLNETLEQRVAQRTQQLVVANQRLEALAMTDQLTGLPNRRNVMNVLGQLWKDGTADDSLVCMMIDADGFKKVNDTLGHDAGDEVLRHLARELGHSFRTDDTVARLGGDEFLAILPHTDLADGLKVAEKLRVTIDRLQVAVGSGTGRGAWKGSISVGVAVRTADMADPEDLIRAADGGVYLSKEKGRNCVSSIQTVMHLK